jgi:hypothetical protein
MYKLNGVPCHRFRKLQAAPEEAGTMLGRFMARTWGNNIPPESFVRAMDRNWQVLGILTEILEADEGTVRGRRLQFMPEKDYTMWHAIYDFEKADYDLSVHKEIASHTGLDYDEQADGDHEVFTVKRKP